MGRGDLGTFPYGLFELSEDLTFLGKNNKRGGQYYIFSRDEDGNSGS